MTFDWHDAKHDRNLAERGFGFDVAAMIFAGRVVETIDERREYGETRTIAIGEVDGIVLTVVYTDRDDVRWIISARRANRRERTIWHDAR